MSSRMALLIDHLESARRYTVRLLDDLDPADWFRLSAGGVTHVGWQVGHLTIAEYRLALERVRGVRPEDAGLFAESFFTTFGRGSMPVDDPSVYPTAGSIREAFDRVHGKTIEEVSKLGDDDLDEPALKPHPLFTTKQGALLWCGQHEFVHAGQIGLVRRWLGREPLW